MMKNINIKNSSVQLCQLGKDLKPESLASGCIISYKDKRLLLTVEHATGNKGNWAIQMEYDQKLGTKCYQLGSLNFIMKFSLFKDESKTIDFTYCKIPSDLEVCRHYLSPDGNTIKKDIIHTYKYNFDIIPDPHENYGFSGTIKPNYSDNIYKPSNPYLVSEFRCYEDLKFIREENEYYVFKLPFKHPGHENFHGCSGAPIINSKNELVGLICNGNIKTDEIFALALPKMKAVVDASIFLEKEIL